MRPVARSIIRNAVSRAISDPGVGGGGGFDILSIFVGKQGGFYEAAGLSAMYEDTGDATPATAADDPVASLHDATGNGNRLLAQAGKELLLKFDADGTPYFNSATGRCMYSEGVFDLSASSDVTVFGLALNTSNSGTGVFAELSSNGNTTAGSFYVAAPNGGGGEIGFSVTSAYANYNGPETYFSGIFAAKLRLAGGASAVTGVINRADSGLTVVGTAAAGPFSATQKLNFMARTASATVSLPTNHNAYCMGVVSGHLTDAEISQLGTWMLRRYGFCVAASIGDSTIAAYSGTTAVSAYVTKMVPTNIAVAGHTIAQQKSAWQALSAAIRASHEAVVMQIGLNDLGPAEAASVAIARLQDLVTTVRADVAAGCKVFVSQMLPCRARLISLYGGVNGPIAYQKWLDMNAAIAGSGTTPITGVDGRITAHVALLNDGSGNLDAAYDTGDGIHENNAGRQIIAAAWRDAIVGVGLLKAI